MDEKTGSVGLNNLPRVTGGEWVARDSASRLLASFVEGGDTYKCLDILPDPSAAGQVVLPHLPA